MILVCQKRAQDIEVGDIIDVKSLPYGEYGNEGYAGPRWGIVTQASHDGTIGGESAVVVRTSADASKDGWRCVLMNGLLTVQVEFER